jgi:hypothetical protein
MSDVNEARKALLAHYEREYAELGLVIARLRRDLGVQAETRADPDGDATGNHSSGEIRPGDFFGMTQVQAIHAYLDRCGRRPASLQDIAAALYRGKAIDKPMEGPAALRNLSSILSRADEFISVAKGRWGLAEWYPGRAVKRARKGKGEPEDAADEPAGEGS